MYFVYFLWLSCRCVRVSLACVGWCGLVCVLNYDELLLGCDEIVGFLLGCGFALQIFDYEVGCIKLMLF